jgi:hypothetical protein
LIVEPNCLAQLEKEIGLSILPAEFQSIYRRHWISAQSARAIWEEMGLEVPVAISNYDRLILELGRLQRLTEAQVIEFNSRALR